MKSIRSSSRNITLMTLATVALTMPRAADINSVWNGGIGNWSVATNWTPNANFPNNGNGGLTYNARVSGGTVTLTEPITLEVYTNSAGTLTGDFPLTLNAGFIWSGGTLSGSATPTSVINILSGATWSGTTKTLTGRTVSFIGGNANWTAGTVNIGGNALLYIAPGASFDTAFAGTLNLSPAGTTATIINAGTFRKSGSGTGTIDPTFNNQPGATVSVTGGILTLAGGGNSGGAFSISDGATLSFSGGTHTLETNAAIAATGVAGSGTNRITAGTLNMAGTYSFSGTTAITGGAANFSGAVTALSDLILSGGTLNFNTPGTGTGTAIPLDSATISGGTLGGTDNLTLRDGTSLTWSGGTITGPGGITAPAITLSGGNKTLTGRTLELSSAGTATWSAGNINSGQGAVLHVPAGTVFNNTFDGSYTFTLGGASAITNSGTFRKSGGTAVTAISPPFYNLGTVEVNVGTLSFNGGGSSRGAFSVADNATLRFAGGNHSLEAASSVTGAGTNAVTSGSVSFGGSVNTTGGTSLSGGSVSFVGPVTSIGALAISGSATASFDTGGAVPVASLTFNGGTLQGGDNLNVAGPFTWTGGVLSGAGALNANGPVTLSGGNRSISGRTLNLNAGTNTWSAGTVSSGQGAALNIAPGAVLNQTFDGSYILTLGGSSSITNRGTFRKSSGGGTVSSIISAAFNNESGGRVEVNGGSLTLNGGGSSSGAFAVGSLATLQFGGGTHTLDANTTVGGSGTNRVTAGVVNLNGSVTVSGGIAVSGGTANFNGSVGGGAPLSVSGGTANFNSVAAVSFSSATLSGSGTLGGTNEFTVTGPFVWSGGTVTGAGRVNANGGATLAGASRILTGRTLRIPPGTTLDWNAGDIGSGQGSTLENAGTMNVNFDGRYSLSQGGVSTIANTGIFRKEAGTGTTRIEVSLNNNGSVVVNSGTLNLMGGGTSAGSFTAGTGATLGFSGGTHHVNAGSTISGPGAVNFDTFGTTVNIAGTYNVAGPTAFTGGTVNFNPGAVIQSLGPTPSVVSGQVNFNTGNPVNFPTLALSGGGIGSNDTVNVAGLFTWAGGQVGGAGVFNANGGALLNGQDRWISGRTLILAGTSVWSAGSVQTGSGSILRVPPGATFSNTFDGYIGGGGTAARFENGGTFRKTGGSGPTYIYDTFANSGSVEVNSGSLELTGDSVQSAGVFFLNGGSASFGTYTLAGGVLKGAGSISGAITNGAAVNPGASPGILNLNGSYSQLATGTLNIEIGGTTPGSGYDQLNVNGDLALGGELNLTLINAFLPNIGDSFRVLTFVNRAGDFAVYKGMDLGVTDRHLEAAFDTNGLTLVTRPGPLTAAPPLQWTLLPPSTIQFTWPLQFSGYQLESTTDLAAPSWSAFGSPTTNNTVFVVVNPADRERYFRLGKP